MDGHVPGEFRFLERTDGRTLAVRSFGTGPPLLALAGGPGANAAYLEDLGGLDTDHRLLVPDARGTGRSEPAADDTGHGFAQLALDIETIRDAFGLAHIDIVAHSAACTTALLYTSNHPDRVRSLCLVCPSAHLLDNVEADMRAILDTRSHEPWYRDVVSALGQLATGGGAGAGGATEEPFDVPDLIQRLAPAQYARWTERERANAALFAIGDIALIRAFWASPVDAAEVRRRLTAADTPTLVVTGGLDSATGVRAGAAWSRALPNARHVNLDDAAHVPWVDNPERFAAEIRQFRSGLN